MQCIPKFPANTLDTAFVIVFANTLKTNPLPNMLTRARQTIYIGVKSPDFVQSQLVQFDKIILLEGLIDYERLRAIVAEHISDPEKTRIAITEYRACMLAARLREEFGIPGSRTADVLRFIDKGVMKKRAIDNGIRVPKYVIYDREAYLSSPEQYIASLERDIGYPIFIKPTCETACQNVFDVGDKSQLISALTQMATLDIELEIDECIQGTLFSLQGIVCNDKLQHFRCGRYSNPSHLFGVDRPYGLIHEHPQSTIYARMFEYLNKVVAAFAPWQDGPMFAQAYLSNKNEIVFVETENRKAGNLTVDMTARQCGVNIEMVCIDMHLGSTVRLPEFEPFTPYERYGAWVTYRTLSRIKSKSAVPANTTSRLFIDWMCNDGSVPKLKCASSSHSAYVVLINDSFEALERDFEAFVKWTPYVTEND